MRVRAMADEAPRVIFDPAVHLTGRLPDVPTPFDAADALDVTAFTRLCRRLIDAGALALVVCTATGEAPTLTRLERETLIRCAVAAAAGRAAVLPGVTSCSTAEACALAHDAAQTGAAAILVGAPYYNKPTQAGIEAHVRAIAAACDLPIVLHDEPGRAVRGYADDTIARLAELPAVVGLCDASGDTMRPPRLRARVHRGFRLLSGDDASAPAYIATGGDGCISPIETIRAALDGGGATAWSATNLAALADALARESAPAPLKFALAQLGIMADTMRLPLVSPSELTRHAVAAALSSLREEIRQSHLQGAQSARR